MTASRLSAARKSCAEVRVIAGPLIFKSGASNASTRSYCCLPTASRYASASAFRSVLMMSSFMNTDPGRGRNCSVGKRAFSPFDEAQQVGVQLLLVRRRQPVGRTGIDLQHRALDDLGGGPAGGVDGDDLIVVTVDDQRRDVDPLQVFGQIGLGELLDAIVGSLEADLHAVEPELLAN